MSSIEQLWGLYRDESVVTRAEHFAKFTQPSLMVDSIDKTAGEQASIQHDFQSVGSLLLNNLASKLTPLLFPSNQPFFKNVISDDLRSAARKAGIAPDQLEAQLSLLEQGATRNLFKNASFAKLTRVIKLLITTGQALIYRDPMYSKFRVWSMHNFAVRRDAFGDWQCIILKERLAYRDIPLAERQVFNQRYPGRYKLDTTVYKYTKIERVETRAKIKVVKVMSEIDGVRIGEIASYPEHLSPWVLPVWDLADGEHYARGLVEAYAGDFAKLSVLSEQLGLYELDSLQVLNLVNAASGTSIDDIEGAEPGAYIPGQKDAIVAHEVGDYNKMNAVRGSLGEVVSRLSLAFMYTGNTRDAERVTAEEIRVQAKEAETMLGGAYSVLAETLQTPLAYLMMSEVGSEAAVGLINKSFYPEIITGIPALNRNVEVQNLVAAVQEAAGIVPALVQLDPRIDPSKVLDLLYRNRAVDISTLMKSADTLRQEAIAKQQQADMVQNTMQNINPETLAQ